MLEDLRARGERLSEELGRESYLAGAGLKADTDFAGIFARYADLAGEEAWEAAHGHRALFEWAVDNRVARAVAALDDRLHAWEAGAEVVLPTGERLPYQRVAIAIANEPRRERRLMLDHARRRALGEPATIRRRWSVLGVGDAALAAEPTAADGSCRRASATIRATVSASSGASGWRGSARSWRRSAAATTWPRARRSPASTSTPSSRRATLCSPPPATSTAIR